MFHKRGLEIFQNVHEIFKYLKVQTEIFHHAFSTHKSTPKTNV